MIFFINWRGKGIFLPILLAIAMFAPIIALRQIDGPEIDHAVGITMGVMAIVVFIWGWRLNHPSVKGEPAAHSFFRIPLHFWAVPMLVFAVLLGTRVITTEEGPRRPSATERLAPDTAGPTAVS